MGTKNNIIPIYVKVNIDYVFFEKSQEYTFKISIFKNYSDYPTM